MNQLNSGHYEVRIKEITNLEKKKKAVENIKKWGG